MGGAVAQTKAKKETVLNGRERIGIQNREREKERRR